MNSHGMGAQSKTSYSFLYPDSLGLPGQPPHPTPLVNPGIPLVGAPPNFYMLGPRKRCRAACQACWEGKTRCTMLMHGGCLNCVSRGRVCVPRSQGQTDDVEKDNKARKKSRNDAQVDDGGSSVSSFHSSSSIRSSSSSSSASSSSSVSDGGNAAGLEGGPRPKDDSDCIPGQASPLEESSPRDPDGGTASSTPNSFSAVDTPSEGKSKVADCENLMAVGSASSLNLSLSACSSNYRDSISGVALAGRMMSGLPHLPQVPMESQNTVGAPGMSILGIHGGGQSLLPMGAGMIQPAAGMVHPHAVMNSYLAAMRMQIAAGARPNVPPHLMHPLLSGAPNGLPNMPIPNMPMEVPHTGLNLSTAHLAAMQRQIYGQYAQLQQTSPGVANATPVGLPIAGLPYGQGSAMIPPHNILPGWFG